MLAINNEELYSYIDTAYEIESHVISQAEQCKSVMMAQNSSLTTLTLNIRSINKNFYNLLILLDRLDINFDLIILTEFWLKGKTPQAYNIDGYTAHSTTKHRFQNDGLIIYCKNNLNISVHEPDIAGANSLLIKVEQDCVIIALYRSPSEYNIDPFLESLSNVLNEYKHIRDAVLTGDFNLDISKFNDSRTAQYLCLCSELGMRPAVTQPTRQDACLDHVMVKSR